MKAKVISSLISLLFAIQSFAAVELSRVKEKGTNREIIYSRSENGFYFHLKQGDYTELLRELSVSQQLDYLTVVDGADVHKFKILKKLTQASGSAYEWCWTNPEGEDSMMGMSPAMSGIALMLVGLPVTAGLCAVGPGVPFIVGVALLPFDGIITVASSILDKDAIAARKFAQLIRGKNPKASSRVFEDMLQSLRQ